MGKAIKDCGSGIRIFRFRFVPAEGGTTQPYFSDGFVAEVTAKNEEDARRKIQQGMRRNAGYLFAM